MLPRSARIALVLFQFLWLNIIVPGHTRGVVQLPGTKIGVSVPLCCQCSAGQKANHHQQPTPAQRENCAICFFAAHLSLPPPFDVHLAPLGLAAILPLPSRHAAPALLIHSPPRSRAPPDASV